MMKKIAELFDLHVARSQDTSSYEDGPVPFISSTELNNGIVRHVKPVLGDRVFSEMCAVVSGLGFATVHTGVILPKGNGGDSCTILVAKVPMTFWDHIAVAAAFNCLHQWRFSFGRKCGKARIKDLEIPWPLPRTDCWPAQRQILEKCIADVDDLLRPAEPGA